MENQFEKIENHGGLEKPKKRRFWLWFFVVIFVLIAVAGAFFYKASFTFSQMNSGTSGGGVLPISEDAPKIEKDADRINILLLGLRGPGDPNGGLLTDTMMVLSFKQSGGQVAMISIPRDLYVKMPTEPGKSNSQSMKEKINFAYALGEERRQGGGLDYAKVAVQSVTGLYIDYVISVDFTAFKDVVDILGGIDIHLSKPFIEDQQWVDSGDAGPSSAFFIKTETSTTSDGVVQKQKWVFEIPAGTSHLDGNTALYYARARYSSSDFNRVERQQQVLLAMKDKAMSLGILLNPVKVFGLLDTMGRNVRTDMALGEINNLISLSKNLNFKNIQSKVFDTTPEGLLYATTSDKGAYILLPQGDNYDKIRGACKNIFQ
jgi:LCP family protein required for cell wall assembly